ncbi:hypothetical protein S100390_v1c06120 [Spiroplasma sp. NBRC 100390]|uniref:hypothetical protein n=1 Tax=unclassified Spiroplasma TaxID=2637901 RepID=UPI0008927E8A|nr:MULTISPECIES: hypothetical protein [unclassified Spiroplasma]AOX43949.1 hypothetical protein STU14_v1c06120 [Spiroplasma sp. TU-14]APE13419.1 hypothetical protein S100390_v1c06120 [Spiroplasma sp. NBRC 100390]
MPFTFKTSPSILKVNYVDLTALQKLTTEPIKDLKAVVVNYSFGYTGTFKTLINPSRFNIKYVITNNPNLIKTLMLDLTNKMGKILIDFINQNPEVAIDKNPAFKETYDMFSVYYERDATLINKDMLVFLDDMFKKNDTTKEIMAVVKYDSNQDILDLKKGTINSGNRINYDGPWSEMQNQTPAAWSGQGQQPAGLTAENFVKFYRAKMSILQDTSKDLTLGTFSINFNKIVVAGLPLLASGFNDNKPLMIEIKISQTGLNTKLTNFGNIIVTFIKYYNVKLRRSGTNEFYMKQRVLDEIIAKYGKGVKSIRLNPLYSKILEDFKQSDIAKTLPDLDLLSLQDFRSYSVKVTFNETNFSVWGNHYWSLGFYFGNSAQASLAYTAWVQNYQHWRFNKI